MARAAVIEKVFAKCFKAALQINKVSSLLLCQRRRSVPMFCLGAPDHQQRRSDMKLCTAALAGAVSICPACNKALASTVQHAGLCTYCKLLLCKS